MDFGIISRRPSQIIGVCGLILAIIGLMTTLGQLEQRGPDGPKRVNLGCEPACRPVQYRVGQAPVSASLSHKRAVALTTGALIFGEAEPGDDDTTPNRHLATAHDTLILPPAPDWAEFISQKLAEVDSSPVILASPQESKKSSLVAEAAYTSTHQVHARSIEAAPASNESELAMVQTQPLPPAKRVSAGCPQTSAATFEVIPIEGPVTDHPDVGHGDLNIALRGYQPVAAPLDLVFYEGQTDPDPPQLTGLFQPNRPVLLQQGYQVNHWLWDAGQCGGQANGCAGSAIGEWDITLVGLAATPGETINIPQRSTQIYGGGYKALVLYAAEQQITLGYTRRDTVAAGYVVHIEGVCVDPNLLTLYQAQHTNGWRSTGALPALRNDQSLGTAAGAEIRVAIRDNGAFMDPRSSKDWWH